MDPPLLDSFLTCIDPLPVWMDPVRGWRRRRAKDLSEHVDSFVALYGSTASPFGSYLYGSTAYIDGSGAGVAAPTVEGPR